MKYIPFVLIILFVSEPALAAKGNNKGGSNTTTSSAYSLIMPADITTEATSANGAIARFDVYGKDGSGNSVSVSCSPTSGSQFALGTTEVVCKTSGKRNVRATDSFRVTVVDSKPPVMSVPAALSLESPDGGAIAVNFSASATDIVSGSVNVSCTPAAGSTFTVGTHSVNCSASDAAGNSSAESFAVVVSYEPVATTDTTDPTVNTGTSDTTNLVAGTDTTDPVVDTGTTDTIDPVVDTGTIDTTTSDTTTSDTTTPVITSNNVLLTWVAPSVREDGSPLALSDIAKYEIYVVGEFTGVDQTVVVNDPAVVQYTISSLQNDNYHFAISAVDVDGQLSQPSATVSVDLSGN